MRRADMEVHPVELGQLVLEYGDDAGEAGAIRRRVSCLIQGEIPKLTA